MPSIGSFPSWNHVTRTQPLSSEFHQEMLLLLLLALAMLRRTG